MAHLSSIHEDIEIPEPLRQRPDCIFSELNTHPTYSPVYASPCISQCPAQNSGPSGSLLLSREDSSSSASCRLSGRAMARIGLRMMPTFPSSPLKFRTVGFPQYGFKAGLSKGACPVRGAQLSRPPTWFASFLRAPRSQPVHSRSVSGQLCAGAPPFERL